MQKDNTLMVTPQAVLVISGNIVHSGRENGMVTAPFSGYKNSDIGKWQI